MDSEPVKLFAHRGRILVWNADDADVLRTKHRIVGTQIGCLPQTPFQNACLGMPMHLSKEEAHLLLQKGVAALYKNTKLGKPPTESDREHLKKYQDEVYQEQSKIMMERRTEDILRHADSIVAGKVAKLKGEHTPKKKRKKAKREAAVDVGSDGASSTAEADEEAATPSKEPEIDREVIIQQELEKVKVPPRETTFVAILTECPLTRSADLKPIPLDFPSSPLERIRCKVFADLWEKGNYLSCGAKFGGDFLVYSGNPLRYHAYAVVTCVESRQQFGSHELISRGRLGNSVRKTAVLATLEDDRVAYLSVRWAGEGSYGSA